MLKTKSPDLYSPGRSPFFAPLISSAGKLIVLFTLALCSIQEAACQDDPAGSEASSNYQIIVGSRRSNLRNQSADAAATSAYLNESEISTFKRNDLTEISNSLPGLNYAGGTSRPRFFQLRGIGERELFEGVPSNSVRIIYDDIDFSGISSAISLFDVDEIATLYGPQSFAVGPSAYAGAVILHSYDPSEYNSGKIEIGGGTNDSYQAGAAVGGSLVDSGAVLFRASMNKNYINGFRRNVFLDRGDTNERDGSTARIKLDFKFSETDKAELMYLFADMRDGYDVFTIDNNLTTESDKPGFDNQRTNAVKFKLINELDSNSKLTNIFAFAHTLQHQAYDADWGNNPFWSPYDPYDYAQEFKRRPILASHEIRYSDGNIDPAAADSTQFEGGYFAAYRGDKTASKDYSSNEVINGLDSRFRTYELSPFIRYQYALAPLWIIDSGGRVELRDFNYEDSRNLDTSDRDQLYGGNFSLRRYKEQNKAGGFYYTTLSTGEKPGGVNPGTSISTQDRLFNSERLWNLEVGSRDRLMKGKVTTNLSLFYGVRKSQQVRTSSQLDPQNPATFSFLTDNAASGNLYGLDGEVAASVTDRIRIRFNGELLRTNIYDYTTPSGSINGRDQSHAPNWSYSTAADYALTEAFYVGTRITGKGSFYFDEPNLQRSNSYHLFDAHLGYAVRSWKIEVWGRNIFDRQYQTRGFFFGNEPPNFENKKYVQLGDPAWFGVTLGYEW